MSISGDLKFYWLSILFEPLNLNVLLFHKKIVNTSLKNTSKFSSQVISLNVVYSDIGKCLENDKTRS